MKTTYLGLATTAMVLLAFTSFARAEALGPWTTPLSEPAVERAMPLGDVEGDPLGLLWGDDVPAFDEEIVIKDGMIVT